MSHHSKILYIMRGLPGSGKTTRAKKILKKDKGSTVRVNRDAIREMLWPKDAGYEWSPTFELLVNEIEYQIIRVATQDYLKNVVVDNTHVKLSHIEHLEEDHPECNIKITNLLWVKISTCVRRDKKREKTIGEEIIRKLAAKIE